MVEHAMNFSKGMDSGKTIIYASTHGAWSRTVSRPKRSFESVILDSDAQKLLEDAKEFLQSEQWYHGKTIQPKFFLNFQLEFQVEILTSRNGSAL